MDTLGIHLLDLLSLCVWGIKSSIGYIAVSPSPNIVRTNVITNETTTEITEMTKALPQSVSKYRLTKYNQKTNCIKLTNIPSMKTVSMANLTTIPSIVIKKASENFALSSPTIVFPENQSDGAVTIVPEIN
jgi:hypothetical protein